MHPLKTPFAIVLGGGAPGTPEAGPLNLGERAAGMPEYDAVLPTRPARPAATFSKRTRTENVHQISPIKKKRKTLQARILLITNPWKSSKQLMSTWHEHIL
jgi:hypothetical protein